LTGQTPLYENDPAVPGASQVMDYKEEAGVCQIAFGKINGIMKIRLIMV